jgi:hypothetical protein
MITLDERKILDDHARAIAAEAGLPRTPLFGLIDQAGVRIASLEARIAELELENRKLRDYGAMQRAQSAPRTIGELMGYEPAEQQSAYNKVAAQVGQSRALPAPFPRKAMR